MNQILRYLLAGLIAYLLGSISTGILVARATHGPDLHTVGSKSTGASNVQRTLGWKAGLITFWGDALKAVLACLIGLWLTGSQKGAMFAGLMVIIGHNWPVFFRFQGGKGVACSCGVMAVCFPIPAVICFAAGVLIIWLTRFISVGSMSILTLYAIIVSCFYSNGDWQIIVWSILLALMCIIRHRANIQRLMQGKENKLGTRIKTGDR